MKNKNIVWLAAAITVLGIMGCSSIKNVPYNFAENEETNGTAKIIFPDKFIDNDNYCYYIVRLVDFEGEVLPEPAEKTRWNPLQFPAGKELDLRVYVLFRGNTTDQPGYRRRGIFKCPALEAGKTYKLWFEKSGNRLDGRFTDPGTGRTVVTASGAGRFILTMGKVKKLKYLFGIKSAPLYKQIYVQEIPPLIQ